MVSAGATGEVRAFCLARSRLCAMCMEGCDTVPEIPAAVVEPLVEAGLHELCERLGAARPGPTTKCDQGIEIPGLRVEPDGPGRPAGRGRDLLAEPGCGTDLAEGFGHLTSALLANHVWLAVRGEKGRPAERNASDHLARALRRKDGAGAQDALYAGQLPCAGLPVLCRPLNDDDLPRHGAGAEHEGDLLQCPTVRVSQPDALRL